MASGAGQSQFLQLQGVIPRAQYMGWPARAYRAAAQTLGAGSAKVLLDTVDYDPAGATDTGHFYGGASAQLVTNGNKFIVPMAGYYLVTAQVKATSTASGQQVQAQISKNGSNVAVGANVFSSASGQGLGAVVSERIQCTAAGDYLELFVTSAGLVLVVGSTTNYMSVQQVA